MEWTVEFNVDFHQILFTLYIDCLWKEEATIRVRPIKQNQIDHLGEPKRTDKSGSPVYPGISSVNIPYCS